MTNIQQPPIQKTPTQKLETKIIALDLDDTLLKEDLSISDYTVSTIQKAAQAGIYIVLCSGRTENGILPYVRRLEIAGTEAGRYIISQNGSTITDLHQRKDIFQAFVPKEILLEVNKTAQKYGLFTEVYDSSTIYVPEDNEWARVDVKLSGLNMQIIEEYEKFLEKGHPKMLIPGDPEKLQALQAELKKDLGDKATIFISKPYFLEILPKNCGKGEAILQLANHLNIPKEKTMSFGDSMNDESMFTHTEHAVAMQNALPEIQKIAKYITATTNNQDGVAHFITDWVL